MYEWLPHRLEQAMEVFQKFSLDWSFVLNEPATESFQSLKRKTTSNEDRFLKSGNLVDHVLEEILPSQAKTTYTLIDGQESVCTEQDDFDEFNDNLTFSDE